MTIIEANYFSTFDGYYLKQKNREMAKFSLSKIEIQDLISRYSSELRKLEYQLEKTQATIAELESGLTQKEREPLTTIGETPVRKTRGRKAKAAPEETQPEIVEEPKPARKRGGGRKKKEVEQVEAQARSVAPVKEKAPKVEKRPRIKVPKAGKIGKVAKIEKVEKVRKTAPAEKPAKGEIIKTEGGRAWRMSVWDQFVMDALRETQKAMINQDLLEMAKIKMTKGGKKLSDLDIKIKLNQSLHKLANKKHVIEKVSYAGRGFAYVLPEWMGPSKVLKEKFRRQP